VEGNKPLSRIIGFNKKIRNELRSQNYNVYNPHFALYAFMPLLLGYARNCAVVGVFQGPWAEEGRQELAGRNAMAAIKGTFSCTIKKWIEKLTYSRCDKFIVLSQEFKKVLVDQYGIKPDKVVVVPGACDTNRFAPGDRLKARQILQLPLNKKIVFTVRRLVRRVGVDILLKATKLLVSKHPDLLVVVGGKGPVKSELEALAVQLGIHNSVIFTGFIPEQQLPLYYQAADVMAVPSIAYEGFGLVTVEALACGVPVVGTPVGGTKEILGRLDSRLISRSSSPEDFATALNGVLSVEPWVPDAETCRVFVVHNYSWQKIIYDVCRVFSVAINDKFGLMEG
ncbi:MAG: glycosyltransferase family 4 protein, partial [Peptococcaceae bacterium]|nr:glycosyltransferase family 4 protein [Peptococcaceae bacterium]